MPNKKPRPDARRKTTIVFDGACLGNPGPGGYGAIVISEATGREKIVRGSHPATTNNRMELTGAIEALKALPPGASVTITGDSEYVTKGMTEWLPRWKARGWRTAAGKPVLNVGLWRMLEAAVARHASVTWKWTRGHSGDQLNERADRIASTEARRVRPSSRE